MQFENRFTITRERYLEWVKHPVKNSFNYNMRIAWVILLIFVAGIIFFQIFTHQISLIVFSCGLAVLCIYRVFFRATVIAKKQFKQAVNMQGAEQWERLTTFSDDIEIADGCSIMHFEFTHIAELVDCNNYLALGIGPGRNKSYLRLARDGFGQNTDEEFVNFIKREHPHISVRNM